MTTKGVRLDLNCGGDFLWNELGLTIRAKAGGGQWGGGGADRKVRAIGYDSYNQELCGDVAQTVRLPSGGDSTAKVIVIRL